jgi:hypothetical protein
MNSFEQFTLVIGGLAILLEALKHLRHKIKLWLGLHPH